MARQEKIPHLDDRIGELCRNVKRKKILAIAKQTGWEIVPAGKERLKARRQGYSSVSIPGSNDNSIIAYGTAYKVIKSLLEPLTRVSDRRDNSLAPSPLPPQHEKVATIKNQLAEADRAIVRLEADVEAGLELAVETEKHNQKLKQKIYQDRCWIKALKRKIADLIHQRAQQESEMLAIADAVEQQELRIQSSATQLTQLSSKLQPKLRRELKQIVDYLTEGS